MSYFSGFMRQIQICRQESHFLGLYKPPRAFSIAGSVLKVPQKEEVMVSSWEQLTTN
jgi:hypothetical protein